MSEEYRGQLLLLAERQPTTSGGLHNLNICYKVTALSAGTYLIWVGQFKFPAIPRPADERLA